MVRLTLEDRPGDFVGVVAQVAERLVPWRL